ncbi:hypothetical protein DMA11_12155 [Marinilabiliaceae bacterium JC017]|nr:hypothetical protein DMA11_12155 [Marinilabiliaceae bacterium JC017]
MRNYLFYVLGLLLFASCSKEEVDNRESIDFYYLPRPCELMEINHACRQDMGKETGESDMDGVYYVNDNVEESVKVEDYLFRVDVGNINSEIVSDPDYSLEDYLGEHDVDMEKELDRYLEKKVDGTLKSGRLKSSSEVYAIMAGIEYRTDEVKRLEVISDVELFGVVAGSSLNGYVELFSAPQYHSFLFSHNKQLIGSIERGWSLEKYMSVRPLAAASLYLRFKSVPEETPVKAKIIVEMELANGKVLRSESDAVNLLP